MENKKIEFEIDSLKKFNNFSLQVQESNENRLSAIEQNIN